MNTLNVRLLVILIVVALVLGGGIYAINRYQINRTAPAFRDESDKAKEAADAAEKEAEAAYEAGDFVAGDEARKKYAEEITRSVNMLTQYTKLYPKDLDALEKLGYRLEDANLKGRAFNTLERLLREDPERTEARRHVVDLALVLPSGRHLDAKMHLEDYLLKDPEMAKEVELWEKLAICQWRDGKREEAIATLKNAIEKTDERPETYLWLAQLLRAFNNVQRDREADAIMAEMAPPLPGSVASNGGQPEADQEAPRKHLICGRYLAGMELPDTSQGEPSADDKAKRWGSAREHLLAALDSYDKSKAEGAEPDKELDEAFRGSFYSTLAHNELKLYEYHKGQEAKPRRDQYQQERLRQNRLAQAAEDETKAQEYLAEAAKYETEAERYRAQADEYGDEAQKCLDESRRFAAKGIKIDPRFFANYATLAKIEIITGRQEGREILVELALGKVDDDEKKKEIEEDAKQTLEAARDKAFAVLDQGLKETRDDARLLLRKAEMLIDFGKLDEAKPVLSRLRGTNCPAALIDNLEAMHQFRQGNYEEAIRLCDRCRPALRSPTPDTAKWMSSAPDTMVKRNDVLVGRCYDALGNYEEALESYQRALDVDPLYTAARSRVAATLFRLNRTDEAYVEYNTLRRQPNPPANVLTEMARILIHQNLRLEKSQQNWEQAEQVLEAAARATPDNPNIPLLFAEIRANQGREDEAERLVIEARDKDPDNLRLWISLLNVVYRQKKWDDAEEKKWERVEEILDEFDAKSTDDVAKRLLQSRLLRAQYLVRRYGLDVKPHLDALAAQDASQLTSAQQTQLLRGMLQMAVWGGDDEQIVRFAHKLLDKDPTNVSTRFLLFEMAMRTPGEDRLAALEKELAEIRKIDKDGTATLFGEAVCLTMQAEADGGKPELFDEALAKLREIRQQRPTWHRAPLLVGGIELKKGNLEAAMEYFGEAIELGARNPEAIKQYIQLLWTHRQYDKARETFELLMQGQEGDLSEDLVRMKRDIYSRFDPAIAEEEARRVAENSTRARDHLFLGQLLAVRARTLRSQGNRIAAGEKAAEAQLSLQKAIDLDPTSPDNWLAMVRLLATTRRVDQAKQVLEQGKAKMTGDKVTPTLAECYELVGDVDEAEKLYLKALEADSRATVARTVARFYLRQRRLDDAEAKLTEVVSGAIKGEQTDRIQARRQLAAIYASRGDQENRQKAEKLLRENINAAGLSQDRRQLVELLSSDPDIEKRRGAVDVLGGIENATPTDLYNRARLLAAQDRWAEASRIFGSLLSKHPQPKYLATYIVLAMQRGELDTAGTYLGILEQKLPHHPVTYGLKARLAFHRGQYDQVTAAMRDYIRQPSAEPANPADRTYAAAKVLEQIARGATRPDQQDAQRRLYDDAETMYREFIRERPARQLELAAFLARGGRTKGAMDYVEKARVLNQDLNGQIGVCIQVLASGKATPEEERQAEAVLQKALEDNQRPSSLLMRMADLRNRQQRFDEAEALYREVLQKSPNQALAMNNLAVLLALRNTDLPRAKALIDKAFSLADARLAGAMLDSKATVYTALGETDVALDAINRAIAENGSPVRYFHQARAYEVAGDDAAAIASMKQAINLGLTADSLEPLEVPAYKKLLAKANAQ